MSFELLTCGRLGGALWARLGGVTYQRRRNTGTVCGLPLCGAGCHPARRLPTVTVTAFREIR
jgi:hypothetical protein